MISFINRLRKNKGFTIIELVVVMAIMGVILAMVLPSIMTSDKPSKGNALAKDFFYKAQDTMSISKIANPDATFAAYFYVALDSMGQVTETGMYNASGGFVPFVNSTYNPDTATDLQKVQKRFYECCENYFVDSDRLGGIIMVDVNSNFAVQSCYWFETTKTQFSSISPKVFNKDNVLDGYYCGAYPTSLVMEGKAL